MNLDVSPVFYKNYHSQADVIINQGGTRSGKTYSILQNVAIKYCLVFTGLTIDIVRKTQSEIRDTVLPDWEEILSNTQLTDDITIEDITEHKASYLVYHINGNTVRFIGLDKAQKKRGSKRDLLYINEANGITLEDWTQLSMRCTGKIYIDFNPSEQFWVHDNVMENENYIKIESENYYQKKDNPLIELQGENGLIAQTRRKLTYEFIKSTYLDNIDFLSMQTILFIESLIGQDHFYEQVYVHGNLTRMRGKIYDNFEMADESMWEDQLLGAETFYGLDPGYEHYFAFIQVKYYNEQVYERCLWMKKHKLDEDFLDWLEEESGVHPYDDIYVDSAAPSLIKKLRQRGFTARLAKKDVRDGIRFCQSLKRFICNDDGSIEYKKQMQRYKYKQTSDGKVLDGEPLKVDDDGPDAVRYAEYTHLRKRIHRIGIS